MPGMSTRPKRIEHNMTHEQQSEELANLVQKSASTTPADWIYDDEAKHIADAILAAGYTKPRTITSVEELDALAEGAVILGGGMVPRIKSEDGRWLGDGRDVDSEHIIYWVERATVLFEADK